MSWECFPVWAMASMGSAASSPAASKKAPGENAAIEADAAVEDHESDIEEDEETSSQTASAAAETAETVHIIADDEISETTENSDSIDDYEAIIKAEKERLQERLDEIANYTHTGISVEGGCRACAYQYELNDQTQADFAGRDVEAVEEVEKAEGGPLDQPTCIVM